MSRRVVVPVVALLALVACSTTAPARADVPAPRVLVMDGATLAAARADVVAGSAAIAPAIAELRAAADAALGSAPVTVTDKTLLPPSGDPHDYVSLSIYWWPDAAKPGGTPYLQRDGQVNPEASDLTKYDGARIVKLVGGVETLALAGYLTGERAYSDAAARGIRAWFIDERTRMNPSMRFAQIIPGRTEERGTGIIESRQLLRVVDAARLLDGTPSWSAADGSALRAWFGQFADWLTGSAQGQMEGRATNNHGTWYDAQLVGAALFAGRTKLATDTLTAAAARRIVPQLEPDGRQPKEAARTRSFHYSAFNMLAFALLGDLGRDAGVDVWHGPGAERIRAGIDFLVAHRAGAAPWPYADIEVPDYFLELAPILARASRAYPDAGYDRVLAELGATQKPLAMLKLRLGVFGSLGGAALADPVRLVARSG